MQKKPVTDRYVLNTRPKGWNVSTPDMTRMCPHTTMKANTNRRKSKLF